MCLPSDQYFMVKTLKSGSSSKWAVWRSKTLATEDLINLGGVDFSWKCVQQIINTFTDKLPWNYVGD